MGAPLNGGPEGPQPPADGRKRSTPAGHWQSSAQRSCLRFVRGRLRPASRPSLTSRGEPGDRRYVVHTVASVWGRRRLLTSSSRRARLFLLDASVAPCQGCACHVGVAELPGGLV